MRQLFTKEIQAKVDIDLDLDLEGNFAFSLVPKFEPNVVSRELVKSVFLEPLIFDARNFCGNGQSGVVAQKRDAGLAVSTSLELISKIWRGGVLLPTGNADGIRNTQIAMDAKGNALAVWEDDDGTHAKIWASRFTAGLGWGLGTAIGGDSDSNAFDPQIAVDAEGNAVALWRARNNASLGFNIWANQYSTTKGWGVAQLIEAVNIKHINVIWDTRSPKICIGADGSAVITWHQFDGVRNTLWAKRCTKLGVWSSAELIETNTTGHADCPDIATSTSGHTMVVWQQFDGLRSDVWASLHTLDRGWGHAKLIETGGDGGASDPQVVFNACGAAIVVWEQYDGVRWTIWANNYVIGCGWGEAKPIGVDNVSHIGKPYIATDADGNAMVVWSQREGMANSIWANSYDAIAGWGVATLIGINPVGTTSTPQISNDNSGRTNVLWWQSDAVKNESLWINGFVVGVGWCNAMPIESSGRQDSNTPQVITGTGGNVIALWRQTNGSSGNIWANGLR
jgi:hypothetical protein